MKAYLFKILGSLGYMVQYGCIAHCTFEYVGNFVVCSGPSMEPTIHSNDILLTEHVSVLTESIKRGDIVIAKCPVNPKQQICKRVVGLSGERVKTGFSCYEVVPLGHIWLQGDNKNNSTDSRNYGPVPLGLVKSRALCRVWPLQSISMFTT